jgi:hypothetical protein
MAADTENDRCEGPTNRPDPDQWSLRAETRKQVCSFHVKIAVIVADVLERGVEGGVAAVGGGVIYNPSTLSDRPHKVASRKSLITFILMNTSLAGPCDSHT